MVPQEPELWDGLVVAQHVAHVVVDEFDLLVKDLAKAQVGLLGLGGEEDQLWWPRASTDGHDGEVGIAVGDTGFDDLQIRASEGLGERRDQDALMVLVWGDVAGDQSLDEEREAPVGAVKGTKPGEQLKEGPVVGVLYHVALDVGFEGVPGPWVAVGLKNPQAAQKAPEAVRVFPHWRDMFERVNDLASSPSVDRRPLFACPQQVLDLIAQLWEQPVIQEPGKDVRVATGVQPVERALETLPLGERR